jgi:hypothetical protein
VKVWEAIFVTLIGAALAQGQAPPPELTEDQRKAQELLRQKVEERQKKNASAQTNAVQLTQAEVEQQYLAGKITAKQFQQYLRQQPAAKPKMSAEQQVQALQMLRALTGKTNTPVAEKGASAPVDVAAEPANPAIVDVEGRIRELEKLKEAREKGTNAPTATVLKTKREKLDALLKQFVDGKISDAEYKEQRAKIIAGPD